MATNYFPVCFLWWATFVSFLGYFLVRDDCPFSLFTPCQLPPRKSLLYRLPIISYWLFTCHNHEICISCAPFRSFNHVLTELLTVAVLTALWMTFPLHFFIGYSIYASALIITIRSDGETFFISRYVTLFLIPIIWLLCYCHALPLSITESIIGAASGYLFLETIRYVFNLIVGQQGLGQGDSELLALIGAATGVIGAWFSLFIGACFGMLIGGSYIIFISGNRHLMMPFGPFLAVASLIYLFVQPYLQQIFLCHFF